MAEWRSTPGASRAVRAIAGIQKGHVMEALKLLFTSDFGLYSLGVILFMVGMGIYLTIHVRSLMNGKPGKEGWQ